MIKNGKQASVIRERLHELRKAKSEFEKNIENHSSDEYEVGVNALDGLIQDNINELVEYENLIKGNINCLDKTTFEDIAKIFISSRLAQNLSQKDLANKLGMKEQQIQRYESTNFESASYDRLLEVAYVLELKLQFQPISLTQCKLVSFTRPSNVSDTQTLEFEKYVKNNCSLII